MDDATARALIGRLDQIEKNSIRYAVGEVTSISPLSVKVSGASTAFTGLKAVVSVKVGDIVAVFRWGNDMLVLPQDGASNRAVRSTIEDIKLIRGTVNTAGSGTITAPATGSAGFTINRTGVGVVAVTFSAAFSTLPSVVVSADNWVVNRTAVSVNGFTANNFNSTTGAAIDQTFSFIAAGPR